MTDNFKADEVVYKTAALKIDGADGTISEEVVEDDDEALKAAIIFAHEVRTHNEASLRAKFADAPHETWLNPDREDVDDWTTQKKFTIYNVDGMRDNKLTPAKRNTLTAVEMRQEFKPYPVPTKEDARGWFAREVISHDIKEGAKGNKGNDNVASVSLIVLDVDNKEGEPLSARNIRRVLKRAGLAALLMESFSSTPDCPKFRIVLFLLTPFMVGDDKERHALYKRLYAYLMKLFPRTDPSTKDVSRFWFDPSYPTVGGNPGLCEFVSGNMLEANYLSAQVPKPERVKSHERVEVEDASPQREVFDHVIKVLRGKYANASIMRLIYGALGSEKNGGFEHPCPFWSGHASEKDKPQPDHACVISWDADVSETGVAVTRCPHTTCKETHKYTTADYLFAALMEHCPEVLESIRAFGDFMREYVLPSKLKAFEAALATWAPDDDEIEAAFDGIEAAEGDQQKALARAFLKRVAVLPEGVDTLTLLERLQPFLGMTKKAAEAVFKAEKVAIGKKRTFLANQNGATAAADERASFENYNARFCLARVGKGAEIAVKPTKAGEPYEFIRPETFHLENAPDHLSRSWLEWSGRDLRTRVIYRPHNWSWNSSEPGELNLFTGFPYEPAPGDWGLLRKWMFEEACHRNPLWFATMMAWIADIFQYPEAKKGCALILKSEAKGTGKSHLAAVVARLLGRYASAPITSPGQVTGKFNATVAERLFIFLEEAFFAGDYEAMGAFRSLVTDTRVMIERKGVDAVPSEKILHAS